MRIYNALQIGEYHLNYCDDYICIAELGSDKLVCAVMDGCTMAIDSYFASTLVGKLLRKITKEKSYKELYGVEKCSTPEDSLKSILGALFAELIIVKNQIMLEQNELLTTLILLVVDKKRKDGVVLVVGDGLVNINGKIIDFDQSDKPDYLGFHLAEDFESWYLSQTQKLHIESLDDISICTDGISMFKKITDKELPIAPSAISYLAIDKKHCESEDMLNIKLKELEYEFGVKPTDDLAIVRIIS
jgi:Protein phosphatase 2C